MKKPFEYLMEAHSAHLQVDMPASYWQSQPVPPSVAVKAIEAALADAEKYRYQLQRALRRNAA